MAPAPAAAAAERRDVCRRSGDDQIVPQPVGVRRRQRGPRRYRRAARMGSKGLRPLAGAGSARVVDARHAAAQRSSSLVGLAATVFARLR